MQTLTRLQLITLYTQFNCNLWRSEIKTLLSADPLATDDTDIVIPQALIVKLKQKGLSVQLDAVMKMGIELDDDHTIIPDDGQTIRFHGALLIGRRIKGIYVGKSFFLSEDFNWEIKEDDEGAMCLIPTKRK